MRSSAACAPRVHELEGEKRSNLEALDVARRDGLAWRTQALESLEEAAHLKYHAHQLFLQRNHFESVADDQRRLVEAMRATLSWRVTTPLRAVRSKQRAVVPPAAASPGPGTPSLVDPSPSSAEREPDPTEVSFLAERLAQAAAILCGRLTAQRTGVDVGTASSMFEDAARDSTEAAERVAWLATTAVLARWPARETPARCPHPSSGRAERAPPRAETAIRDDPRRGSVDAPTT